MIIKPNIIDHLKQCFGVIKQRNTSSAGIAVRQIQNSIEWLAALGFQGGNLGRQVACPRAIAHHHLCRGQSKGLNGSPWRREVAKCERTLHLHDTHHAATNFSDRYLPFCAVDPPMMLVKHGLHKSGGKVVSEIQHTIFAVRVVKPALGFGAEVKGLATIFFTAAVL